MPLSSCIQVLKEFVFICTGGLHKTGLVQSYSISHYVPFLPLEKVHVVQCLQREVSKQHQVMSNELEQ